MGGLVKRLVMAAVASGLFRLAHRPGAHPALRAVLRQLGRQVGRRGAPPHPRRRW